MEAFGPTWLAGIASAVIICLGQALIAVGQRRMNLRMDESERRRSEAREETEAKRRAEAEWRDEIEARLSAQDSKIDAVLKGQCTQMRSDLVHRSHRYIDDLGRASTEEKDAFYAEYRDSCDICEAYGIENSFIDELAKRVMALPNREIPQ